MSDIAATQISLDIGEANVYGIPMEIEGSKDNRFIRFIVGNMLSRTNRRR